MNTIIILGSTGSIGTQTLDIIRRFNDKKVVGLSCGSNIQLLRDQIIEFKPKYVSTLNRYIELENEFKDITFMYGADALERMALLDADEIVNSVVGSAGLVPTLNAIKTHKKVFLSNKETLVIGGELVNKALKEYSGILYPIDSEHSSLWQLLDQNDKNDIDHVTITASGGPFRDLSKEEIERVNISDALNHPNWKMGKKITIDSATMMNKGFEIIEAHYLFNIPVEKIKTIINYESLVHASITLKSGETILGVDKASMMNPIIRALYYPEIRYELEKHDESEFHFKEIDLEKYPCLTLAYDAIKRGGCIPAVLNASNEAAVNLFLNGKIKFTEIYKINEEMMNIFDNKDVASLENILKYDMIVKEFVLNKYN